NGLLSEGDSVLWASTDLGLIRWSITEQLAITYTQDDGLAANEFNRMSFYQSRAGRMYFGGLNGVVAFTPSPQLKDIKRSQQIAPMMFTRFSHYHGPTDSLILMEQGLHEQDTFRLHPQDRVFNIEFALADFRAPAQNEYSYYLEGYENQWSPVTKTHSVRYNGVPPGSYTFHARGKSLQGGWSPHELSVHIVIERPFYMNTWFWVGVVALAFGLFYAFYKYRVYRYKQQQEELARQVQERTRDLEIEKQKSEDLLLNILPVEAAKELKEQGFATARRHNEVTVMFSDFVGFTRLSEMMEPEDLVAEIDRCFRAFDEITERHGLEKIKTVGDAYLCVGGIYTPDEDEAQQVVKAALEMQEFLHGEAIMRELNGQPAFRARIGIHTGPIVAGIVGIKKFAYDIWGDTV
ncbi:MAG: adenylate/guanylate cyclase domain-containing protein, partial [Bacteroidota bacterium]